MMLGFDVDATVARLREGGGGYEVVHLSPGLEIGVYLLVAPRADEQTPHTYDEVYVVLSGSGQIEVDGETRSLRGSEAVFVGAGAEHRFSEYDEIALLVIFNGPESEAERGG
jgi:mannose-6-phosphate isomerase-like protein (cupin superfamily)